MNARLIDHLRDNAGDALDLFDVLCDHTNGHMTEVDLIAALLHHIDERGGDVAKSHATALGMYQAQVIDNALIELGGTKR
jgi:hypothetical protein